MFPVALGETQQCGDLLVCDIVDEAADCACFFCSGVRYCAMMVMMVKRREDSPSQLHCQSSPGRMHWYAAVWKFERPAIGPGV